MLYEMYEDDSAFKGDANWHHKDLGLGSELRAAGAMASSGAAHLLIEIKKNVPNPLGWRVGKRK